MNQPIYLKIKDDITKKINKGILKTDEKLDSERILCEEYGTSLPTVKKALKLLINQNYIRSVERVGYYVNPPSMSNYKFDYDNLLINDYVITDEIFLPPMIGETKSFENEIHKNSKAVVFKKKIMSSKTILIYTEKFVFFNKGIISNIESLSENEINNILKQIDNFSFDSVLQMNMIKTDEILAQKTGFLINTPLFEVQKKDFDRYNKLLSFTITYFKYNVLKLVGKNESII